MRILILSWLFSVLPNVYWVEEIKAITLKVDAEAELTKSRSVIDRWGEYGSSSKQFEYKLEKTKKTVKIEENLPVHYRKGYKYQFYHRNKFVFYADYLSIKSATLTRCSICASFNHNAAIIETKKFFKNDSLGLAYSRTIPYCLHQNLDSMKHELGKMPFEIDRLNRDDYIILVKALKSARYKINYPDRIIER